MALENASSSRSDKMFIYKKSGSCQTFCYVTNPILAVEPCYDRNMFRRFIYRWFGRLQALHVSFDNGVLRRPVIVFVHGIGSSGAMWQQVMTHIEAYGHLRLIGVDLLGFGESPKPDYAAYTVQDHAKALAVTLRKRGIRRCAIVGHSLGSLVAIEFAKQHPGKVDFLILGSPPFYTRQDSKTWWPTRDDMYRSLYQNIRKRRERTLKLGRFIGEKLRPNRGFMLNEEILPAFMKTLEKSIEQQTSLQDAEQLKIPVSVIYGSYDPVIIFKNIRQLKRANNHVQTRRVAAGHEINQRYVTALEEEIEKYVKAAYPKAAPPR